MKSEFTVIAIGRVFQVVFAVVSVRLATTLLGPYQIGRMNLVLSLFYLLSLLLISPIANYVARHSLDWKRSGRLIEALAYFAAFLAVVAFGSLLPVTLLTHSSGIGTPIGRAWLAGFIALYIFVNNFVTVLTTVINTIGHRVWYIFFSNLSSWSGLGIATALVWFRGATAEHWMEGLLAGQAATALFNWLVLHHLSRDASRRFGPGVGPSELALSFGRLISFSWPLLVSTGLNWVQISGYRFVLAAVTDVRTIGFITTGLALAIAPMAMVDTLFTEYYRPIFYRDTLQADTEQTASAWNRYAAIYLPSIVVIAIFVGANGPFMARILISPEFRPMAWLAGFGAVVQAGYMTYGICVSLAFALLNTRTLILANLCGAVVSAAGIFFLGRHHPMPATGLSLAAASLVTMAVVWWTIRRHAPIRVPWRHLGLAALVMVPMALCSACLSHRRLNDSLPISLLVLALTGAYAFLSLVFFVKKWAGEAALPRVSVTATT